MNNIIEIDGDLLHDYFHKGNHCAIAHICNCQGVMGSGIAFSIRNYVPGAYTNYKKYQEKHGLVLGTISYAWPYLPNFKKCVINLHAQQNYGRGKQHLDYEALRTCLAKTQEYLLRNRVTEIGIPYRMGSDRAGGDWNTVLKIVGEELNELQVTVVRLPIPI